MSELTKFECDVSGEWFGAKNDVVEFEIRRYRHSPFEISKRTVHISLDVLSEYAVSAPTRLEYVGVEEGEVVGASIGYNPYNGDIYYEYEEREGIMLDQYEPFWQFVEEEILY